MLVVVEVFQMEHQVQEEMEVEVLLENLEMGHLAQLILEVAEAVLKPLILLVLEELV
jgi:hypothetical protein